MKQKGLICPECGNSTNVIDCYDTTKGRTRRRECRKCGYRYSTIEISSVQFKQFEKAINAFKVFERAISE